MHDDFKATFDRMLKVTGKTLNEVAELGGLDRAYLWRLYYGERTNPSPETVIKIWIGLVFDREILEKDVMMQEGLKHLAASLTMTLGSKRLLA